MKSQMIEFQRLIKTVVVTIVNLNSYTVISNGRKEW